MIRVLRRVEDSGVEVSAEIPEHWSELPVDGYVLVAGGPLGDPEGTVHPVVQVTLRPAASADAVWQTVLDGAAALPEAHEAFRTRRPIGRDEEAVVEVAHRSPVTGGTQVSILRTVFRPARAEVVSVVGTCGGAASPETRDTLRRVVASVRASGG